MPRTTCVFLLGLVLAGCLDGTGDRSAFDPVDSRIRIGLTENLTAGPRTLTLQCSTEKDYPCCNWSIENGFSRSANRISIAFTGIYKPEICLTAFGPASASIALGTLEQGTYPVSVTVNGQAFTTDLTVSAASYAVAPAESPLVTFPKQELLRVPDGTIWGYVGYHAAGTAHIVESFMDSLVSLGAHPQRYQSGDYGYFVIDSAGAIVPPLNSGFYFTRPFIYHFPAAMDPVRALVSRYGKGFGDSLDIALYGCHGEAFFSWVLGGKGS